MSSTLKALLLCAPLALTGCDAIQGITDRAPAAVLQEQAQAEIRRTTAAETVARLEALPEITPAEEVELTYARREVAMETAYLQRLDAYLTERRAKQDAILKEIREVPGEAATNNWWELAAGIVTVLGGAYGLSTRQTRKAIADLNAQRDDKYRRAAEADQALQRAMQAQVVARAPQLAQPQPQVPHAHSPAVPTPGPERWSAPMFPVPPVVDGPDVI